MRRRSLCSGSVSSRKRPAKLVDLAVPLRRPPATSCVVPASIPNILPHVLTRLLYLDVQFPLVPRIACRFGGFFALPSVVLRSRVNQCGIADLYFEKPSPLKGGRASSRLECTLVV